MKVQVTLTVAEAKALIAEAIAGMSEVQTALQTGRILLKGGTTVAAVAQRLANIDLRLSGRISPRGTKASGGVSAMAHSVLLEGGQIRNIDNDFSQAVVSLRRHDVAVIGANAIDYAGRAAMLLGRPLGGSPGLGIAGLMAQGCRLVIACGLEKLIPGTIDEAIKAGGIFSADWSMGMATGLTPLTGHLITEKRALEMIAAVHCTVIACGGIAGAEGGTTLVLEGEKTEISAAIDAILAVKGAKTTGCPASLVECTSRQEGCAVHQSCAWRTCKGEMLTWHVK